MFDDTIDGSALAGQLTIVYSERQRQHSIDEELMMPSMTMSHKLRAVAVATTAAPYVAVSNPGAQAEAVTAACSDESGPASSASFSIQPMATIFLQGCVQLASVDTSQWGHCC